MRSTGLPLGGGNKAAHNPGKRKARVGWVLSLFLPWVLLIQRMEEGWQGLITITLDVPESGRFRSLVSPEMETAWKRLFNTPQTVCL